MVELKIFSDHGTELGKIALIVRIEQFGIEACDSLKDCRLAGGPLLARLGTSDRAKDGKSGDGKKIGAILAQIQS